MTCTPCYLQAVVPPCPMCSTPDSASPVSTQIQGPAPVSVPARTQATQPDPEALWLMELLMRPA